MTKILIAYYSWSGTTKRLAEKIHQFLPNSNLLEIKVPSGTFSDDMYQTDAIAKKQKGNHDLPQITNSLPSFSDYDCILVGGPVWSYSPSTPVLSFLDKLGNYQGEVAPFYTSVGNDGDYESQFGKENSKLDILSGNSNGKDLNNWIKQFMRSNKND